MDTEKRKQFMTEGNLCGARVRLGRAMHNKPLTQQQLADKLQFMGYTAMTKTIISRIEKGGQEDKPNEGRHVIDSELKALAEALDVSMSWLVGETDDPKRY